jgi:hypothetical protein
MSYPYNLDCNLFVAADTSLSSSSSALNNFFVAGDTIRLALQRTPASASDAGYVGEICYDTDYIYVCVATDTWKRAAISTW